MVTTYVITVWTDLNGKIHTSQSTVQAGSISEAKAKFKATHRDCKTVNGVHKKQKGDIIYDTG